MEIEKIPYEHSMYLPMKHFPTTYLTQDEDGVATWNEVIKSIEGYHQMPMTKSGYISNSFEACFQKLKSYNFIGGCRDFYLSVIDEDMNCFRLAFKDKADKNTISGVNCWRRFEKICEDFGVDLADLKENDKEKAYAVKMQIPNPRIWGNELYFITDESDGHWSNVHHIDIHSAHMSGVAKACPVLEPVIQELFDNRKTKPFYKDVLTHTWGYMQSKFVGYGFSHLSKAGIEYTNSVIDRLTNELRETGRTILAQNTDGIWYMGDIYHGIGEGKNLGEWANDWQNCKFRMKSKGCYEFIGQKYGIGEAVYKPVVRGFTKLDLVEPDRTKWNWGDIYKFNYIDSYKIDMDTLIISEVKIYGH